MAVSAKDTILSLVRHYNNREAEKAQALLDPKLEWGRQLLRDMQTAGKTGIVEIRDLICCGTRVAEYWVEAFEDWSKRSVIGVNFYEVLDGQVIKVDQVVEQRDRAQEKRGGINCQSNKP